MKYFQRLKITLTPLRDQKTALNILVNTKDIETAQETETKCLTKDAREDNATPSKLTRTITV